MTTKTTAKRDLPPGILASDLKYPGYDKINRAFGGDMLIFYQVEGRRGAYWCLATLLIGKSRSYGDRTYAITLDGNLCRVGKGPHVKQTVNVYVSKERTAALQKYIDLFLKGASEAGQVRDRISSRRAEGQLRRSRGETFWYWNR